MRRFALSIALAAVAAGLLAQVSAAVPPIVRDDVPGVSFLPKCAAMTSVAPKTRCYVKGLLADIEASKDPSRELPRIDQLAKTGGPFLRVGCHALMHQVGREYAKRHHLTLSDLQHYLPRSNSSGCSAGFAHGLIMELAPQVMEAGPKKAAAMCTRLSTRFRRYTCIHGLGHAYMRVYAEQIPFAIAMCRQLGRANAQDCAQGVFHDYWISRAGRDHTVHTAGPSSPRVVCGKVAPLYVRPCWYRVFIELPPKGGVQSRADMLRLCRGLTGLQRSGCLTAASVVLLVPDVYSHVRMCARLPTEDQADCVRGVSGEEVENWPSAQLALIRLCSKFEPEARPGCYEWFGKALSVVTNGDFMKTCAELDSQKARDACEAGAKRMNQPLVTFA